MKTIKLNDKKIIIPESLTEINIEMFQKINQIKDEYEIDRELAVVSCLTGLKVDEILDLPLTNYCKIKELCTFINDEVDKKPTLFVTIDGIKYGYRYKISEMITNEFIDYDFLKKDNQSTIENLHLLMAILYRPIIDDKIPEYKYLKLFKSIIKPKKDIMNYEITKYKYEELEERGNLFRKEMRLDIVLSALNFLLAIGIVLLDNSLDSTKMYSNPIAQKKL